ncbi:MAG: DUF5320 domain-containing protein, partial [Bacteroidales bacterium]|nr:DUF5320 domain-containing protein [Bacteroidales bacterium]
MVQDLPVKVSEQAADKENAEQMPQKTKIQNPVVAADAAEVAEKDKEWVKENSSINFFKKEVIMPGYDQTGPLGQGAITGRRSGRCAKFAVKASEQSHPES